MRTVNSHARTFMHTHEHFHRSARGHALTLKRTHARTQVHTFTHTHTSERAQAGSYSHALVYESARIRTFKRARRLHSRMKVRICPHTHGRCTHAISSNKDLDDKIHVALEVVLVHRHILLAIGKYEPRAATSSGQRNIGRKPITFTILTIRSWLRKTRSANLGLN